jgi:hypothetical protein
MSGYILNPSVLRDQEQIFEYDDPSGWIILQEAGFVQNPVPFSSPIEYYTQQQLQKKYFGYWCHLFLKRTTCLEIAITLDSLKLTRYYVSRGAPVTTKAFYTALSRGIEYFRAICPNLNPKLFFRLKYPRKLGILNPALMGELPNDIGLIKEILTYLESPGTLDEYRHILRIIPSKLVDGLSIKKIWHKEFDKEPEPKEVPEPDEPNVIDVYNLRKIGETDRKKDLEYLISSGHIELRAIWEEVQTF